MATGLGKHVPVEGRVNSTVLDGRSVACDFSIWHTSVTNLDGAAYAELFGATGIRVEHRSQLDDALRRVFSSDGPTLLCVQQDAALL